MVLGVHKFETLFMNEDIIVKKIRYTNVKIFQFGNFDLKKG
jgi:hypothetical protein